MSGRSVRDLLPVVIEAGELGAQLLPERPPPNGRPTRPW
jgi:hypothetical protein